MQRKGFRQQKQRTLKVQDQVKIQERYNKKVEEYKLLTIEELKAIWDKGGLSSTDKEALINQVDQKLVDKKIAEDTEKLKLLEPEYNGKKVEENTQEIKEETQIDKETK